jgi:seryl-tRNA synthetase
MTSHRWSLAPGHFQRKQRVLDPRLIRNQPDIVKEATRVKRIGSPELVDAWIASDLKKRTSQTRLDSLRAEQKKVSEQVGKLKRDLKGGTNPDLEKLISTANQLKADQESLTADYESAEAECEKIMLQFPAIPDPSWPIGKDDSDNVVVRTWENGKSSDSNLAYGKRSHRSGQGTRHS